ncbi:NAD(P)-binding Rossmann-fold superfamily protein [Arabidopsis thaliana]|jgi:nucleoside-diphosphate-sugar epimerase|uniref:Protein BRI1-5 ENHANCED 1 n=1 Tax=Arabidopsis thaliana TaxID=3702 RepID=BEN1_ARATH|nr:NAD(P)-binding Rossmann-fold superfamily protein [Arabidopsis thaliana]O22133.1 RecName: Full=Protein BRI1-5 ENHANCED 1 [Arabidopsis thaliana]AAB82624.1 putative flavonol reductase [Arabidopsis thaliana]AEC10546.1 NAD(P)-binding Rossmann-fold superfamily protein [Arabidopsis thaliana]|eukprot:NP_182064.1 NAD(P)-binding Rossmann-fold superfamily protein [Arabidopsis thaliana]
MVREEQEEDDNNNNNNGGGERKLLVADETVPSLLDETGLVCVTGGSGFVASWLIMRLLQRGYSVRATVRTNSEGNKKDISYLTELPFASERLQIFTADLNEPESFKPAIEGCKAVFHVAHPMDPNSNETEETVTKRTVQGLMGILKSCLDAKTVKRFFYTSSAVTVFYSGGNGGGGGEVDESVWSDVEVFRNQKEKRVSSSYVVSKMAAETAALEFGGKNGLEVVTLVIPLVVGPFISSSLPSSVFISLAMLFGNYKEKYLFDTYNMVHIDDVARAMIFLLEKPVAKGRYICSSVEMKIDEVFEFLSTKFPQFQLPSIDLNKYKVEKRMGLSSKKLKSAGFEFKYGAEEIFSGAIRSCQARGFL